MVDEVGRAGSRIAVIQSHGVVLQAPVHGDSSSFGGAREHRFESASYLGTLAFESLRSRKTGDDLSGDTLDNTGFAIIVSAVTIFPVVMLLFRLVPLLLLLLLQALGTLGQRRPISPIILPDRRKEPAPAAL